MATKALFAAVAAACLLGTAACGPGSPNSSPPPVAPSTTPAAIPAVIPASTATASTSPAASRTSSPASFSLVATGDVLLHPALWAQAHRDSGSAKAAAFDFGPMLAGVQPYVTGADLAVCHLETPLAAKAGPFRGYPDFSGPPQIATALARTGYDACSTASNHTLDQGSAGIDRTLDTLDAAGIAHTGSARTTAESRHLMVLRGRGVPVAYLSYAYGFNGHHYPGGQTWRANTIDVPRIIADAKRARAQGAKVVVVALHWGTEYQQTPSAQQLQLAPKLARSGAVDLIISHHSHVVEPIQRIGRVWVVYGLGNLIASHSTPGPANQEGLLVKFIFTRAAGDRWRATTAAYLPLLVTRSAPIRLLSVPAALSAKQYGSSSRARLREALDRTTRVVSSMGANRQGLVRLS